MQSKARRRRPSLRVVVGGLLLVAVALFDLLVPRDDPVRNGSIIHTGGGSSSVPQHRPPRLTGAAPLSAEDGHRLSRHPGEEVYGPLAWLRKR